MEIADRAEGIVRLALAEDLGVEGDVTTSAVCPDDASGRGTIISRVACRIAGQTVAARVFELAGGASYSILVEDGQDASPGQEVGRVEGPLAAVLAGERTALNFLSHLSGIATVTARLVAVAEPHDVAVMDTRKTTPGLRDLEKYAVSKGGGTNHRRGLFDGVIIKDNHIAAAGGLEIALRRARNALGDETEIEVEACDLAQVREAVDSGADVIMLDNMSPELVGEAVALVAGRASVEVSGGITPDNLASYVGQGVDSISVGFITHSAPAVDLSLELEID